MPGPLNSLKVIDMSRVLAGPWAGQLLADYGAEVIKIERPGVGDDTRSWGPPWLRDSAGNDTKEAGYFQSTNRNKRSVTVNLAHPLGQELIRKLVTRSDVLLENYKVGSLQRYGLDATTLCELNPTLIYCSISAYGQSGSKSAEPGYDAMIQAAGGLMSITGESDAEGGRPTKVGVAIADIMAGMYAASAVLAALVAREQSGRGQHIDVPLFDSQVAWLANQNMNYLLTGTPPDRRGTAHPNIVPYQAFQTADGYLMLAVGNDSQFANCCASLGCPEVAEDPRYSANSARIENRDELIQIIAGRLTGETTAYWLDRFASLHIPAGPINDLAQVFSDPVVAERRIVRSLNHSLVGEVPTVANPVRFSDTPVEYKLAPPVLGQHTAEVLKDDLGYSDKEIARLYDSGAI
ncbi:MAG: CoA transferase [Proteobacteria bacterium]|nr:CoA transferase [Pseudomonadota bacterium]